MARTGYCTTDDLRLGSIPLPAYIDPAEAVADAADEMDSYLGLFYVIPIPAKDSVEQQAIDDPTKRIPDVVYLTLKRINANLASGRTLLEIASSAENDRLQAYGVSLVNDALEALGRLKEGQPILLNVPQLTPDSPLVAGPLISNVDAESNVEAFYTRIADPYYCFGDLGYDTPDYRSMIGR